MWKTYDVWLNLNIIAKNYFIVSLLVWIVFVILIFFNVSIFRMCLNVFTVKRNSNKKFIKLYFSGN